MRLKLVEIKDELSDVKSFFWKPDEKVSWEPGQYFYYTLPKLKYDDPRGETRHFTISSSPTEGDLLRLTTKFPNPMSGYKKTLLELKIGDETEGRGPQGVFTINNTPPAAHIFIAGGIGITPFRSMVKYCYDKKLDLPYLIYSNSDEKFVFGEELKECLGKKAIFHNSKTLGHLDSSKISSYFQEFQMSRPVFYVVGSPNFVNAMEENLEKLGIESGKIQSEKFTGY